MSVLSAKSKFLTIVPGIEDDGPTIAVRTSWLLRLLSLGSYDYEVVLDADRRQIEISKRWMWFWSTTRTIPFDQVDRVDNDYSSMGTSWGWFTRHDSVESFRVSLVLSGTGEIVPVGAFRGEGANMTGWSGVMWGDDIIDLEGVQQDASHSLVTRLEELLDLTGRPRLDEPLATAKRIPQRGCVECGQAAPWNRSSCLYCGGRVSNGQ